MLNRRHLRIKIMQTLFAHYTVGEGDAKRSEEALWYSVDKMYEMYIYLFLLIVEMQEAAIERIEAGRNKKLALRRRFASEYQVCDQPSVARFGEQ